MQRSTYYPFPARPGVGLEAVDFTVEHVSLTETELSQILDFEQGLYDLSLDEAIFPGAASYKEDQTTKGTPLQSLESVWKLKVNSFELGVNYFITDEGKTTLSKALGVDTDAEDLGTMAVVLASLDASSVNAKTLDMLEAKSVGYEEEQLTNAFVASGFSAEGLPAPDLVVLYKNPEAIVAKARGYRQLKSYIGQVKADLQTHAPENASPVVAAQLLLADKYVRRINGFLASTYISAFKLLAQYRTSGQTRHTDVIHELEEILPAFSSRPDDSRIAGFLQQIDRYRHGVSKDEQEKFTWLSPAARHLATQSEGIESTAVSRDIYEDIDPEVLKSTKIDGAMFGNLLRGVVREYGILSEVEDWSSDREGPAADNKWQVIVNDKFKSLAVNDKQRVIKVPMKIISLMKAVSVGNHEITHVLQHENKRALGTLAILACIGLDDTSAQTEAGGLWQEGVAFDALSGVSHDSTAGTGYYKNIEIKAAGGSFGECVKAYYEDLLQHNPEMSSNKLAVAAQAVNRARRVFRSGGLEFAQHTNYITNTQPLNYLEQRLIYEGLNDETRKFLLVGGITIANLVELRQYGLVDTNSIRIPEKMPWQLMYPAVKALLATKVAG